MIFFFGILGVCLFVTLVAYFLSGEICWKELLIMVAVQAVVALVSALISYHSSLADEEIHNSKVVAKVQQRVSCEHSYCCGWGTCGSGKTKYTCCKMTCHEHPWDWDWDVHAQNGDEFTIDRIDRQGTREPPRWTSVQMNEPTSTSHSYQNYIKASPDSLFRRQGQEEKYLGKLPDYPSNIFDYYRLNRLLLVNGATVTDSNYWNADISKLNAEVGQKMQTNVIVVVAKNMPADYFYALEQHWLGSKKNDVVLVIDLDAGKKPRWVNVMAWESNEIFKVKVRDELMVKPDIERWDVYDVLSRDIVQYHRRKPMADFEYLTSSFTPSLTHWIVTVIVGLVISLGMTWYFHVNETFPTRRYY